MNNGYEKVVLGDMVLEVTTRRGDNGELILDPVQIPEEKSHEEPYFFKITSTMRAEIRWWIATQVAKTDKEKDFLDAVRVGLQKIDYDYWIATLEPTIINGEIKYIEGEKVAVNYSPLECKTLAEKYSPERASRMAILYELLLFYAYRIVQGYWTLDYVANDSSYKGNYRSSPNHVDEIEKAGAREVGGFKDGVGNSQKIVMYQNSFAACGGTYRHYGKDRPVGTILFLISTEPYSECSFVVVLTK